MHYRRLVALGACLSMTACVTRPSNVVATYVSPVSYQSRSCEQLRDEKGRVSSELAKVTDLQQENANTDAALLGVGIVVLPVVALGMLATKDRKEQLAQLKGQNQAIDEAMRMKQCVPPPPVASPPAMTAPTIAVPNKPFATPAKAPKCKDVGGYEAYKAKTGELCEI